MKKVLSVIIISVLSLSLTQAQSVDEIVSKYITAIGGAAKQKALKSRKMTMVLHQSGVQIPGSIIADAENRQKLELNFNGAKLVQAYDGTTGWTINQFQGINNPIKLEGEQAKQVADVQFVDDFIDYKKNKSVIELEGEEDFEGTAAYKIKMTKASGLVSTHFFAQDTGLKIGVGETSGGQSVISIYEDFQETDGIVSARKVTQKIDGQVALFFVFSKVEHNVDVSDDLYAFPGN